jgi:hypothetical protein
MMYQVNSKTASSQAMKSNGESTLVTLLRIVAPYRDSVDGTRDRVTYQNWLRGNVTGFFGVLSVFGRRIKGMIRNTAGAGVDVQCHVARPHLLRP